MDLDSDEDDPAKLLSAWLGELDNLKNDLDNGLANGNVVPNTQRNGDKKTQKTEYRCSLINLETSQNDELDAILGELTQLENKFEEHLSEKPENVSISKNDKKLRFIDSEEAPYPPSDSLQDCSDSSRIPQVTNQEERKKYGTQEHQDPPDPQETQGNRSSGSSEMRTRAETASGTASPDTDSAFCDITDSISVVSVSSGKTDESKTSISLPTCPSSLQPPANVDQSSQEAKIKAEKIRIAIEKIKEASVKKLFIKVFTSDGSAKSLLVDEKMTVGYVTRVLAEKNHVKLDPKWALVELVPDLYVERVYEDHEMLVENCLLWKLDSKNTLWFIERPEKFDLFARPEVYLLGGSSSEKDEQMEEHSREELLEEYFSSSGVGAPQLEGQVWLKGDGKKSWKKFHFVLRSSGLYYAPKGKKTSKDLVCLTTFDMNQVYYGVGWKKKYKSPSDYCFGIKHPQIQTKNPKYIKYLCVDTQKELHQWVTGIRIAKNGSRLFENHRGIVEEIAHADIDILTSKRFSVNSSTRLPNLPIHPHATPTCGSDDNGTSSNARTPSSENKSMASALSSGIEADMYNNDSNNEKYVNNDPLPQVEHDLEESNQSTPVGTIDRECPIRRSFSRSSRSSSSSGCLTDNSIGVEQGFESNSPVGGTIKKRPTTTPRLPLTSTTWSMVREVDQETDKDEGENVRVGGGGTLLRAAVRKNYTNKSDSDLKSPSRVPPEIPTHNQMDDCFKPPTKCLPGMISMKGSFSEDLPLPPPPQRPESVISLGEIDALPPPPPDIWESDACHYHVSPITSPPPITSPHDFYISGPASSGENNSHNSIISTQTKQYASNEYPSKSIQPISVPSNKRLNSSIKNASPSATDKTKPTRKISFDDNVQLISTSDSPQSIPKFNPFPAVMPSPGRLFHNESKTHTPPKAFLADLQRVMSKKWQVAEKCRGDDEATPHKVMGFRDELGTLDQLQPTVYSKDSAIGAWVLETQQYVPTQHHQHQQDHHPYQQQDHHPHQQDHHLHHQNQQFHHQHHPNDPHQQHPNDPHHQNQQVHHQHHPNDPYQQSRPVHPPHHPNHPNQQNRTVHYQHHPQQQNQQVHHLNPQQHEYVQQQQQQQYSHHQNHQSEGLYRHLQSPPEPNLHEESLYAQMYPEPGFHFNQTSPDQHHGNHSSYPHQHLYETQQGPGSQRVQHAHSPHNPHKPVVLREPEMDYQTSLAVPAITKRPPPPPRRSQNTQLSNAGR